MIRHARRRGLYIDENVERETGIEPAANGLGSPLKLYPRGP